MPRVVWTPHLRGHLKIEDGHAPGDTVAAVLLECCRQTPAVRGYVFDEHGRLRKHVVVFVNSRPVTDRRDLSDAVTDCDEIYVLQALSGG